MINKGVPIELANVIDKIIDVEGGNKPNGGYTNDAADRGGETKYGITKSTWRANGWSGPIIDAPRELAETIYYLRYIVEPGFDLIYDISARVGMELIDTGVNMGPGRPSIWLQDWLNAFNNGQQYGPDLVVDGKIGKQSANRLREFIIHRGQDGSMVLLKALNGSQNARYLEIVNANKSQRRFAYGWVKERG